MTGNPVFKKIASEIILTKNALFKIETVSIIMGGKQKIFFSVLKRHFFRWEGVSTQGISVKTVHQLSANDCQNCCLWLKYNIFWRFQKFKLIDFMLPPALFVDFKFGTYTYLAENRNSYFFVKVSVIFWRLLVAKSKFIFLQSLKKFQLLLGFKNNFCTKI